MTANSANSSVLFWIQMTDCHKWLSKCNQNVGPPQLLDFVTNYKVFDAEHEFISSTDGL